jgi:D-alanine--poly(phosphoribitol) ligase subunit 2
MNETAVWLLDWFADRKGFKDGTPEERLRVDYFQKRVLDSFGIMELIGDVEGRFAIQFTDRDFQDRRFSSIGGLAELVADLRRRKE